MRTPHRASPYQARTPTVRRSPRLSSSPSPTSQAPRSTERSPGVQLTASDPLQASPFQASPAHPSPATPALTPPTRRSPRLAAASSSQGSAQSAAQRTTGRIQVSLSPERTPPQRRSPRLATLEAGPVGERVVPSQANSNLFQLVVRPILKSTIGQRDTSGETLADVALNGASFADILLKLWTSFSPRIKGRAIKTDNVWSVAVPAMEDWTKLMQFKLKRHIVDNTKSEQQWNAWLTAVKGETVILLVYEYGVAITKARDLETFKTACILPLETDRAGATAESSLQEVVGRLQEQWEPTFQAAAVVWRMWANHLTRNLDRSTWDAAISQPPPEFIVPLLQPANTQLQQHINNITRSAQLALDCVNAAMADNDQLRRDVRALGVRIESHGQLLATRKVIIEAFITDVLPPPEVVDPMLMMENINDIDHE